MQIAVVGCGSWGENLIRNFSQLQVLKAVCDTQEIRAKTMAHLYGVQAMDFDAVLADPEIDGVVIAASAAQHVFLARRVLEAQKAVFIEKPMALQVAEAEALCQFAEQQQCLLMVGHLLQYHPGFLKLRALLQEGILGRLQYIYSTRLNFGKIRHEESILWCCAPHDISMILNLMGELPLHVQATGVYCLNPEIADAVTVHLRFNHEVYAQIFASWLHPYKEQKLILGGERGMLVFDDHEPDWNRKLTFYSHRVSWDLGIPIPDRAEGVSIALEKAEPLRLECEHFLQCIRTGAKPDTDGREGVRVLQVLEQAEKAMQHGKN